MMEPDLVNDRNFPGGFPRQETVPRRTLWLLEESHENIRYLKRTYGDDLTEDESDALCDIIDSLVVFTTGRASPVSLRILDAGPFILRKGDVEVNDFEDYDDEKEWESEMAADD